MCKIYGCILKIRKTDGGDLEPSVFTRIGDCGITTNILYQARGEECSARPKHKISSPYHCWIAEQAIPLDEFIQCNYAVKSKCTLAAFCCILRAAEHGLYLSDNHFYNFGVKITSDATEHTVVIIDAGSRGLDPNLWTKSEINAKIMKRFWQYAEEEGGPKLLLQSKWEETLCWRQCLKWATRKWERSPILTTTLISTHDLQHEFSATERDAIERII